MTTNALVFGLSVEVGQASITSLQNALQGGSGGAEDVAIAAQEAADPRIAQLATTFGDVSDVVARGGSMQDVQTSLAQFRGQLRNNAAALPGQARVRARGLGSPVCVSPYR